MKYFANQLNKDDENYEDRLLQICVGEMLNIETNEEWFVNGILQTGKRKMPYNTYKVNGDTYEIQGTLGLLHIIDDKLCINKKRIIEKINTMLIVMCDEICRINPSINVLFNVGFTSHYVAAQYEIPIKNLKRNIYLINPDIDESYIYRKTSGVFQWVISFNYFSTLKLPNTIIYDSIGYFTLPDKYHKLDIPYNHSISSSIYIPKVKLHYINKKFITMETILNTIRRESDITWRNSHSLEQTKSTGCFSCRLPVYISKLKNFDITEKETIGPNNLYMELLKIDGIPTTIKEYFTDANREIYPKYVKRKIKCCYFTDVPLFDEVYVYDFYGIKLPNNEIYNLNKPIQVLVSPHFDSRSIDKKLMYIVWRVTYPLTFKKMLMSFYSDDHITVFKNSDEQSQFNHTGIPLYKINRDKLDSIDLSEPSEVKTLQTSEKSKSVNLVVKKSAINPDTIPPINTVAALEDKAHLCNILYSIYKFPDFKNSITLGTCIPMKEICPTFTSFTHVYLYKECTPNETLNLYINHCLDKGNRIIAVEY